MKPIDDEALNVIFTNARTQVSWKNKDVSDELLLHIYNYMKLGPTSANSCPARIIFLKSKSAKEKLEPCLDKTNIEKTNQAPITAIIAQDLKFFEKLPYLFPHSPDARTWFEGNDELIRSTAFRNSSLQGAYLIISARCLGLDCGPMSGFDNKKLDEIFFKDTSWKSNFLCNLGYGDHQKIFPRSPRLDFNEACKVL